MTTHVTRRQPPYQVAIGQPAVSWAHWIDGARSQATLLSCIESAGKATRFAIRRLRVFDGFDAEPSTLTLDVDLDAPAKLGPVAITLYHHGPAFAETGRGPEFDTAVADLLSKVNRGTRFFTRERYEFIKALAAARRKHIREGAL